MSEAFFRLFEGLPRQGPGSDACTREALRRLGPLPPAPRVLDLGCGSGRSALVLAETLHVGSAEAATCHVSESDAGALAPLPFTATTL